MAAYVDRLVLRTSSDTTNTLLTDLATGGTNEIKLGELIVGTLSTDPGLYFKGNADDIIKLPGYRAEGDLYWDNVDLLINAEDGNVDKSINNASTGSISATRNTFNRHGTYSYYFNGSTRLNMGFNSTTTLPSIVSTVECWVYFTDLSQNRGIWTHEENSTNRSMDVKYNNTTGYIEAILRTSVGTYTVSSSSSPQLNTWHHIALVRNNTTATIYLDGTGGTPVSLSGNYIGSYYWGLGVNSIYNTTLRKFLIGYIDDFRLTNDVARYIQDFTPSVYPAATEKGEHQTKYLSSLTDVTITNVAVGQTLVYSNGTWVNGYPIAASIDDMPDVTLTAVSEGDFLIYNGTNWQNQQPESSWFIPADGGDFDTGTVASEGNYILNGGLFT